MVSGYWLPTIRRDYDRVGSAVWLLFNLKSSILLS